MTRIIIHIFVPFLMAVFPSCKSITLEPWSEAARSDFIFPTTFPRSTQSNQPDSAVTSRGFYGKILQADGTSAEVTSVDDPRSFMPTAAWIPFSSPGSLPNRSSSVLARLDINTDRVSPTSAGDSPDLAEEFLAQLDAFTCGPRWSCLGVYASPGEFKARYYDKMNCACDDLCHYFNDCCADAPPANPSTEEFLSPWLQYMNCGSFYGVGEGMSYVGRCPSWWTDESTRTKCQSPDPRVSLQATPVFGITSGLAFRNVFCGRCHGEEVVLWSANVTCTGNQPFKENMTLDDALQNYDCRLEFLVPPNNTNPRPCIYNMLSPSPCLPQYEGTVLQDKCEATQGHMAYFRKRPVKNSYCAACTLVEPTEVFRNLACQGIGKFMVSLPSGPYSLSILFDMNLVDGGDSVGFEMRKPSQGNIVTVSCYEDEVYDPFEKICRQLICKPGYLFVNGSCIMNTSVSIHETDDRNLFDCPRIALNESEFSILPDDTLLVRSSGTNYSSTEYFLDGSTAYVCTSFTRNATLTPAQTDKIVLAFSEAEAIVSTVCLVLSVTSLVAVLIVYSCFGSLRNTPGLILMSLAVALVIAKTLMLVAPAVVPTTVGCLAVGVAMHFFFLASFFWMNVMALDVRATFSNSFLRADKGARKSRRFLCYSLYAWGVPLLAVGAALAVDHWGPRASNLRPGYGEGLCWITNKQALLVFFAGPNCCLVLVNVALFICAARNIYASQTSAQQVGRQRSRRERLSVYARLTAVTGLAWTFGLMAAFIPLPPLWYVFIVANALQGTFIFASFALTPRVLALLSARFGSRRSTSSEEGSTSTQLFVLRVHNEPEP